tara:strand:- start:371 stop:559 length:189 start_codon:yes stop_codon:yes gene_type:complete
MKQPRYVITQTQGFVLLYPQQILILKMVAWQEIMLRGEKYFFYISLVMELTELGKILSRNNF